MEKTKKPRCFSNLKAKSMKQIFLTQDSTLKVVFCILLIIIQGTNSDIESAESQWLLITPENFDAMKEDFKN